MAGLYVHVPFCTQRCSYCDFYTQTDSRLRTDYLRALRRELAERAAELDHEPLDTIYFGGGTPSQLPIEALRAIFRTICAHYDVSSCREITLEANPDDLSADYLRQLHSQLPIRRISLGVQSFDDRLLRVIGRIHTAAEARAALPQLSSMLDRLAGKNIIHKNKAANLKSKLARQIARLG